MKLDYTITDLDQRKALVDQILQETPNPPSQYLEKLADYLILGFEKKQRKLLTENRLATINKRETSFEGLVSSLENGEDGIYNLVSDIQTPLTPKISITQTDLDTIPFLSQLRESLDQWQSAIKKASGRDAFIMKKAIIDMRKDQYVIKQSYTQPVIPKKLTRPQSTFPSLDEHVTVPSNYEISAGGVSLLRTEVVSAILQNYSKLRQDAYGKFESDMWYLLESFDRVCDKALVDEPKLKYVCERKIDGASNLEIQQGLSEIFDSTYSIEYISNLWVTKIPKLIAHAAIEEYLIWYYHYKDLPFKKCSRCGQKKPSHSIFFSRNNASKDTFYSICKSCRSCRKKG